MDSRMSSNKSEHGIALIIALLTVLVLSVLAASIMLVAQSQTWTALSYRLTTQSRYAAEAGVQRTMNWLVNSYTPPATFTSYDMTKNPVYCNDGVNCANPTKPVVLSGLAGVTANYPDSTVKSAYNAALNGQSIPGIANGTYSTYASLLRMSSGSGVSWLGGGGNGVAQTWQITSQGNISGIHAATVQVVATYERIGKPIFTYAIATTGTGCASIKLAGAGLTDSYNSNLGTYAGTSQTSGGNVATNGNLDLIGTAKVEGTFSGLNTSTGVCPANDITSTSSASPIDKGTVTLPTALNYANPSAPIPAPPTTSQVTTGSCGAITGCTQLATHNMALSPSYQYGNLNIGGGPSVNVHLSAGTYNINSLTMIGGSSLTIDSGPVILNIAASGTGTAVDISGGVLTNSTGIPSNFQIVYAGTSAITLKGGPGAFGVIYAPNAPITTNGTPDWYGAVIGSTFTDNGGSTIHYDDALSNSLQTVGNFMPINFSWSKF